MKYRMLDIFLRVDKIPSSFSPGKRLLYIMQVNCSCYMNGLCVLIGSSITAPDIHHNDSCE